MGVKRDSFLSGYSPVRRRRRGVCVCVTLFCVDMMGVFFVREAVFLESCSHQTCDSAFVCLVIVALCVGAYIHSVLSGRTGCGKFGKRDMEWIDTHHDSRQGITPVRSWVVYRSRPAQFPVLFYCFSVSTPSFLDARTFCLGLPGRMVAGSDEIACHQALQQVCHWREVIFQRLSSGNQTTAVEPGQGLWSTYRQEGGLESTQLQNAL
mmetsp:Transcript_1376/g.3447  ORF Transcript_1376/g.3447 Transcript_1376/m.3447 type:complete len:208 (-) Transcript_1376:714-1337(-)